MHILCPFPSLSFPSTSTIISNCFFLHILPVNFCDQLIYCVSAFQFRVAISLLQSSDPALKIPSADMEAQSCLLGLLILFICLTIEASSYVASSDKPQTIYDALQMNGLPKGLLPKAVKSFTVDEQGNFEVHLDKPCYAKFENQVKYEKIVKGNLSYGQIGGLSGIIAQELFLWFPVKGIRVDIPSSGLIYFDVGVVYKQLSLSLFENPPDCKENGVQAESDLMEGKIISEMLTKTLSGRFRYESDNAAGKAIQ